MAKLLRIEGFTPVTAANGVEALDRVNEHLPDLILLDIMMPEMDGPSFLKVFRKMPGAELTPVILVTALSDERELAAARAMTIQGCFTKGYYSFDALLGSIRGVLGVEGS